jgi:hypothetical protein
MSPGDVQAMIDQACKPLLQRIEELEDGLKDAFRPDDQVALQASGGKLLCAEDGGPVMDGQPFNLTGRSSLGIWESYTLKKGIKTPA